MHELFFKLLLVLLPTQLGYHTWPARAMVLGRRVDFLSPTLYLTDILIFLIILFWLIKNKFSIFNFSVKGGSASGRQFSILIFVFATINIFFATNRMVAAYAWLKIVEYSLLGFYIYYTKPKWNTMIQYLSIGVLYSSLIAIGQFIFQHSLGLWIFGERTFSNQTPGIAQFDFRGLWLRAYATFPHPNVLGGFLAILLPLILFKLKSSFYKITTIVFGIIAITLTFSRSAWIAFALGFALQKRKLLLPFVVFAIFIVSTLGVRDESVVVRQELNNSAITMFRESPIVGKGMGNFLVELPNHLVSRQIYFLQPVHNIFLLILSETGIIGFTLFFLILWRFKKPMLIIIIFLGFIDHYFLTLQQGQLLLTILLSSTIGL